ncbi:MAG: glycosyltransferase family 2 protein [Gammaproteobacteria bacterium]|nr:glycosyltransferase family 2 protein [Gammaproteobacteria bacterium]
MRAALPQAAEVWVVDNASTDGSLELCTQHFSGDAKFKLVRNAINLGFARANNLALIQARGDYLVLLNPDCIMPSDTLMRLVELIQQRPEVGMAGCLIRNTDGSEQAGCRRAVPTPWRTLVRVLHLHRLFPRHHRFSSFLLDQEPLPKEPVVVEAISGAFMLVRRTALQQVGLLDDGYFLHCEDLDWCMRFAQAGWKILFVPQVEVVHHKGTCSAGRPLVVSWHKHKGMARFYRKFFRNQYPLPLMALVMVSIWLRFGVLAAVITIRRSMRASFFRVENTSVPPVQTGEVRQLPRDR